MTQVTQDLPLPLFAVSEAEEQRGLADVSRDEASDVSSFASFASLVPPKLVMEFNEYAVHMIVLPVSLQLRNHRVA